MKPMHIVFGDTASKLPATITQDVLELKDKVDGLSNQSPDVTALEAAIQALEQTVNNVQNLQNHFTPSVVYGNMGNTSSTLSISIPQINFKATLTKTSTTNISMAISTITGTATMDIKKLAFYDNGIDNIALDSQSLTTSPNTIDSTIYLATRDNPQMEIWNQNVGWKVNILISGASAERVRMYSYPITSVDVTIT